MRVIHTISSIGEWSGGPARTVTNLCSAIAKSGCNVDFVVGHDAERDGNLIAPSTGLVRLHLLDARRVAGVFLYPGFSNEVERLATETLPSRPSVLIHDHGLWSLANIASAKAARRADVPYVLHPRGMLEPWALQYKKYKKWLPWAAYQKHIICSSAALVATSEQERKSIKRLFPGLPVAVIPNGVALPREIPNRAARSDSERATLLFMSRVHPKKNLLGLIQAWQEVCRTRSTARWVLQIAGPDELDHTRETKTLVHALGLDSRVEFLGIVGEGEKGSVLEAADLFVLPSFSENFGVVVAEALVYGLPVVATRGTPWGQLVERGCGWWVDPTPNALAQALAEGINLSATERHAMGLRGRDYAKVAFSWDRIGLTTVQLYEWILGRTASVPPFIDV